MLLLDATNPAPWPAGIIPAVLTDAVLKTRYRVWSAADGAYIDADNVVVTMNRLQSPMATMTATVRSDLGLLSPQYGYWFRVDAGYDLGGTVEYRTLFWGMLTRAEWTPEGCQIRAASAEAWYAHPIRALFAVPDTVSDLKTVASQMTLYRGLNVVSQGLDTPTSAQLSSFRSQEAQAGDDLDTWFRAIGDCLGQWVRGDYRRRYGTGVEPAYYVTPRPASWTVLDVDALIDPSTRRDVASLEDYFNVLNFTAEWVDSTGTKQTRRRVYPTNDALVASDYVREKAVTVQMRPSGGVLSAGNFTALAWLANASQVHSTIATLRALWWLDPGYKVQMREVGPIRTPHHYLLDQIVFHVDQGLMTITGARTPD